MTLLKRQQGFSLIELMVTMIIAVATLVAATQIFGSLLGSFKQQTRTAEVQVENVVGLELLRNDLVSAGYGLPWVVTGVAYGEVPGAPADALNDAPGAAPRAFATGDGAGFNGSDHLAIKAARIALHAVGDKWTLLPSSGVPYPWPPAGSAENLDPTDGVIVLTSGNEEDDPTRHTLVVAGTYSTTFNNTAAFAPLESYQTSVIYGIDPMPPLWAPFNRADYFIDAAAPPDRCAPNTGTLVKAIMSHVDGNIDDDRHAILDCIADFQVIFRLDTNDDGAIDASVDAFAGDAAAIRAQVKEIRVYMLTHEGKADPNYLHANPVITVGEFGIGRVFDLTIIPGWERYRWKLHTLTVKPLNLG